MARKVVTDQHRAWNIAHNKRLEAYNKRIEQLLNRAITQATTLSERHGAEATANNIFTFSQDRQLKAEIEKLMKDLSKEITNITKQAEATEWNTAYKQAVEYLGNMYAVAKQAENMQTLFDEKLVGMKARNLDALNAFQKRKIGGLNLSSKVWNYTEDFEKQLEVTIDTALLEGKSAAKLSQDVRSLLKDPDALFRHVRDDDTGELRMSKAMKAFHPGPGKYRSAYKNAMRLARTEINMAYRSSDSQMAQQFDACVGIEVHLSNNHNCKGVPEGEFVDICDELQGRYPKDFKFVGWHPQCRCYTTYILKTDEEFWADLEKGENNESVNTVKDVPYNFKDWVARNEDRIARAEQNGTLPYFLRDNESKYKNILQPDKQETTRPIGIIASTAAIKSQSAIEKKKYLAEMMPLLKKKIIVNGNGHDMKVGFNKYGNDHLYNDTFHSSVLTKNDLKDVDKLLSNSSFKTKAKLYKPRNHDDIKRFYYYEAKLHGQTVYLQVAERDFVRKNGRIRHSRFLYCITDKLKA